MRVLVRSPTGLGDPGLEAQVGSVIDSFDRSGRPPPGIAQGGRRGRARGVFENAEGRLPHLIDPSSGAPRAEWRRVAVTAPHAGLADALSTGLALAPAPAIRDVVAALPGIQVRALDAQGRENLFG